MSGQSPHSDRRPTAGGGATANSGRQELARQASGLRSVAFGLQTMTVAVLVTILAPLVFLGTAMLFAERGDLSGLAYAPGMLTVFIAIVSLYAFLGCVQAPKEVGRAWAIAAALCYSLAIGAYIVTVNLVETRFDEFMQVFEGLGDEARLPVTLFSVAFIAQLIANLLFLSFLRTIGHHFRRPKLVNNVKAFIVAAVVLGIIWIAEPLVLLVVSADYGLAVILNLIKLVAFLGMQGWLLGLLIATRNTIVNPPRGRVERASAAGRQAIGRFGLGRSSQESEEQSPPSAAPIEADTAFIPNLEPPEEEAK